MAKQKATQAYISEFKKAREEWKVRERQRMEEENIKIRDFARLQQLRESERMQSKKAKEESMARVQQAVSYQLNERFHILTLSLSIDVIVDNFFGTYFVMLTRNI